MMPIGMMTVRNQGVEYEITTSTDKTLKNIMIQNRILIGNTLSITSTSFEKRLRMRPSGVVSKKDIGSLIVFFSSLLCKSRAARRQPMAKITEVASKVKAGEEDMKLI